MEVSTIFNNYATYANEIHLFATYANYANEIKLVFIRVELSTISLIMQLVQMRSIQLGR